MEQRLRLCRSLDFAQPPLMSTNYATFPQHVIEQKQTTGVRDLETNHFVSPSKFILSFCDVIHNFELCNLPERVLFT